MPHTVYDAKLGLVGGNPYYLRQITNTDFNETLQPLEGRLSAGTYVADQFILSGEPVAQITTVDIGGFIGGFGTEGARITDGSTVIIPWRSRASGGTFKSGTNHSQIRGRSTTAPVQLVPQTITCPRTGPVTASGQVLFLSPDGVLKPHLVFDDDQSLASQAFGGMYGLGPLYVNGTRMPYQVGYTLNFGVMLSELQRYEGAVWPTDCFIETISPSIDMTIEDFSALYDFTGGASITSLSAYIRKRSSGGTYVADTDAVHIKFSMTGGLATPQALSAQDSKHGQQMVRLAATGALNVSNGTAVTT